MPTTATQALLLCRSPDASQTLNALFNALVVVTCRCMFHKRQRMFREFTCKPAKLRRLADAIGKGEKFEIQIAGERIYVPVRAEFSVEHEREDATEEIEFQIKWALQDKARLNKQSSQDIVQATITLSTEIDQ